MAETDAKNVSASPSISVAFNSNTKSVSSAVVPATSSTVGASLTGTTVTVMDCESLYSPSLTLTLNSSLPL